MIKGLENQGFKQLNDQATHFHGGHIDHVYTNKNSDVEVTLYSPYYCAKDHDGLLIEVKNVADIDTPETQAQRETGERKTGRTEFRQIQTETC